MGVVLLSVFLSLIIFIGVLVSIAFLTLIERKLISATQNRKGPNKVGFLGILQPFADALKLLSKETIFPRNARLFIFILSPIISLFFALISWAFIPFSYSAIIADLNIGIFFILTMSILHIYGIILSGWSSNSRYSFLGSIRSTAQLVAYDISIALIISTLALYTKSFSLLDFVAIQDQNGYIVLYLPLLFILFLVSSLAETNRHPFDLPEAESELVGGFNTEYSSSYFAYFFLGEYCSILIMVFLINHLFLGGWTFFGANLFLAYVFYFVKFLVIYYFFIFVRAAIPRYRYDQLMRLGWKVILPLCLAMFFICAISISLTGSIHI